MSVKIVLPESKGNLRVGSGTKVYNDDGSEITDIQSLSINVKADEVITATIEVCVSKVENLKGLDSIITRSKPKSFIQKLFLCWGYLWQ